MSKMNKKIFSLLSLGTITSAGVVLSTVLPTQFNSSKLNKVSQQSYDNVDATLIGATSGRFSFEVIDDTNNTVRLVNGAAYNQPIQATDWTIPSTFEYNGVVYTIEEIGYSNDNTNIPLWQRWCMNAKGHDGFNIKGKLTLPSTIKSIGYCAFQWNIDITNIDLTQCVNLENISRSAFFMTTGYGTTSINEDLVFGPNLKRIGGHSFDGIEINCNVHFKGTSILPEIEGCSFDKVTSSTIAYVPKGMVDTYKAIEHFPFTNVLEEDQPTQEGKIELQLVDGRTIVENLSDNLEELITDADYFAFNDVEVYRSEIQSVKLSNFSYIKELGDHFLINCTNMVSADLSGLTSLTSIGDFFMSGNFSLSEIILPTNIETIGNSFLRECWSLVNVELNLPMLTTVGDMLLAGSHGLKTVDLSNIQNFINCINGTLGWCETLETIYVPTNLVDTYKTDEGWSIYANMIIGK